MPTFYLLLILGQVAVVAAAAAALFFLGSKSRSPGAIEAPRSEKDDAKRVTDIFTEVGNVLAFHGRVLLGVNHHDDAGDENEAALQRAADLATLRHCNRETNRSLLNHNAELGDVMEHYGNLYRSERNRLEAYAAKTEQLNRVIGAGSARSTENDPTLVQLLQEMQEENDRLRVKVADCQNQAAELLAQATRSSREARIDTLTQLPNRRAWEEQVETAPGGTMAFLALADIDRFKQINDEHGHPAGDAILTLLGTLLGNLPDISAFRIGGDEFGLLLFGMPADQAHQIAEEIRAKVQRSTVHHQGQPLNITISFGLSHMSDRGDLETAVERADRALYAAKKAGGNRTHFSLDEPGSEADKAPATAEPV